MAISAAYASTLVSLVLCANSPKDRVKSYGGMSGAVALIGAGLDRTIKS